MANPISMTAAAESAAANPKVALPELDSRVDSALARPDLAAYRGWLKYLRFLARSAAERNGPTSPQASEAGARLAGWLQRIEADPRLIDSLRGVQEWAYESAADGSGQPFKMALPTDYDPAHPAPLSVYMHGYSGNHLDHSAGMASHPGSMDLAVLGRARGGGYRALSEADVLDVIAYVQAHWAIDPDRIHLNGGSMGGGATYRLGSRFPHRWASGRPACGFLSHLPAGNLITFPIYATHSADDYVVSILHERGPLARLRELGGRVIFDETNGYGHAVWDYKEGNERGEAWEKLQVRPASQSVRHIDYTAIEGTAVRGWWGEIIEWGPAIKPARFVLTAADGNTIFAELTNIARLRLRLAEAPIDATRPLHVSVNGSLPIELPAPLPAAATLARGDKGWGFETAAPTLPWRLHTPGSAALLYSGEPLLIVYGTRGSDAERKAMRAAATAASKSPNATWPDDKGDAGPEGIPHSQNLYGRLNTRADSEVTDADIARCHLVLIGTAAQNSVLGRIAARLPVRLEGPFITCSDGVVLPAAHNALGLVHYNPLAPDRLVFWVASEDPAAYAAGAEVPLAMGGGTLLAGTVCGADLLVMRAGSPTLVAARSFDSRWRWSADRAASPLAPAALKTMRDFSLAIGAAIRQATNTDLAMVGSGGPAKEAAIVPGITRVSDVTAALYNQPIGVFEMTGAEITEVANRFAAAGDLPLLLCRSSRVETAGIQRARVYRVAIPTDLIWRFSAVAKMAPQNYRHTDAGVAEALERFWSRE